MPTQIAATPILRGKEAIKVIQEALQKLDKKSYCLCYVKGRIFSNDYKDNNEK